MHGAYWSNLGLLKGNFNQNFLEFFYSTWNRQIPALALAGILLEVEICRPRLRPVQFNLYFYQGTHKIFSLHTKL